MKDYQEYILECGDGSFYTGITNNLYQRLNHHIAGVGSKYVRAKGFRRLLAISPPMEKGEALYIEYKIKKAKTKDKKLGTMIITWFTNFEGIDSIPWSF